MLEITYRIDKYCKQVDIRFNDELLADVLNGVMKSIEPASTSFLEIHKPIITPVEDK